MYQKNKYTVGTTDDNTRQIGGYCLFQEDRNVDIARNASSSSSTSVSSNEPVYKNQTPFVLELHDIRKDEPATDPLAPIGPSEGKIKKHKKKKKHSHHRNASVGSLDSLSDQSSVAPSATDVHEEFYDAHESYHAIPEGTPLGGATTLAIAENIPKVETTLLPPSPETTTDDPIAPTSTPIIVILYSGSTNSNEL